MYLTYMEYKKLGGTKDAATFELQESEIEAKLNYLTSGRIKDLAEIPDAVKQLCFRLHTNFWEKIDIDKPNNLSSYSNGIESFGYSDTGNSDNSTLNKQIAGVIREYLWEYPQLLYRGVSKWKRS